ncbi:hypothetical protein PRIPAC_80776 [Pristionchus pacificus]|uniref:G protein-coupled receptor n=1 Tax=Pristionchus pacificus TaxID=54126 RepID=A0A2A6CJB1_PRIPA|nr:hypothetical protein PRIPAC_80776 [Pristionchus pacificus]|eukprot:PDM78315.1 G protein-coupled receptor [Pristionchus pacificus]
MLICCVNLVAASIYVFMNFIPVPSFVIIIGQTFWQLSHGSPPFIYLALNKSIRCTALESVGLGSLLHKQQLQMFTTTKGQASNISIQIESNF